MINRQKHFGAESINLSDSIFFSFFPVCKSNYNLPSYLPEQLRAIIISTSAAEVFFYKKRKKKGKMADEE